MPATLKIHSLGRLGWKVRSSARLAYDRLRYRLKIAFHDLTHRSPKKPFFLICMPRTGSTLLVSYLNSIPGVSCLGEILNPSFYFGIRRSFITKRAVMRHIQSSLNHCDHKICGAKFFNDHLNWHRIQMEHFVRYFPQAKFIILYRRNFFEQYASLALALKTGLWSKRIGRCYPYPGVRVTVSKGDLMRSYTEAKRFYENILRKEWMPDRSILVCYEDLSESAQGLFDKKISPHLGLERTTVKSDLLKQRDEDLQNRIENYEEFEGLIQNGFFMQDYGFDSIKEKDSRDLLSVS